MLFSFAMISLGLTLTILDFQNGRNLTSVFLASLGVTVMFSGPLIAYILTSGWLLGMFSIAYLRFFHTVADSSLIVTMVFLASLIFVFGLYAEHIRLKANLSAVRMRDLTLHDQLTGAYNRLFLNEYIQKLISAKNRYGTTLSCILIDIDHFKDINDTWGHPVGDRVLVTLVGTVREQLRDSDTITRMGGEEFLILLPETPLYAAMIVAEKIRRITEKIPFNGFTLTISLGVCEIRDKESFESVFRRCDQALYRAKYKGRNRVESCMECSPVTSPSK
ncbi:MAG: GGDEF domain-containing protein [Treponema sp.]|nr:GGDEF domain-containing protein [Treponema sp.]